MSQLKPTPERPLRRQTSSLRAAASHGQGLGSGSGAGLWLSGSSSSGDDEETEADAGHNDGRTYHFPAAVAAAKAPDSAVGFFAGQTPSAGQLSVTDKVDLDLSFDYVSRLEGGTQYSAAAGASAMAADASSISSAGDAGSESSRMVERPSNPTPSRSGFAPMPATGTPTPLPGKASLGVPALTEQMATPAASPSPPRGMATASWSARRKLPPAPLSFLRPGASKKKEKAKQLQQQEPLGSYFSPVTPSPPVGYESEDEEEILPVTPLSATRRGNDSGLSLTRVASNASSGRASFQSSHSPRIPPTLPPTEPLPALPTDVDVAALVKQQRLQAQAQQRSGSPAPSINSSFDLPPPAMSSAKRSVPLGFAYDGDENAAPASTSDIIEHPTTPGARVTLAAFESENDFRQYLRQQQLHHMDLASPPAASSAPPVSRSASVSKNGRPVKVGRESTASLESFMTARTAGTSSQNHGRNSDGQHFQAAADEPMPLLPTTRDNMLGLNLDGNAVAETHEELQDEQHNAVQQSLAAALRRSKGPAALSSPALSDSELDRSVKSSPGTPFSALFSEPGTARTTGASSDYTAPSELGTPSGGTFSKLFGFAGAKRRASATDATLAAPTSAAMTKAISAPGAEMRSGATGLSLIEEADAPGTRGPSAELSEDGYGARQRTVSGMPRSETAEWIRAHAAAASSESLDSGESDAQSKRAPVVLSTHTSDDGEEVFRPRGASFAKSESAAVAIRAGIPRRMSDVRGPWPQSPLLLSTSPAGPVESLPLSPSDLYARAMEGLTRPASVPLTKHASVPSAPLGDAEHGMGMGVGLGLNFGDSTKQAAPAPLRRPDHTEVDMRGDAAPAEHDLVVAHVDLDDLAVDREVLPAKLLVPQVKAVQQLRNSPSVASSIEGFACNVTPPIQTVALPDIDGKDNQDAVLQLPERAKVAQAEEIHRNSALSVLSSGGVGATETSRPNSKAHSSAASGWGALAGLRWGTKFFSIASTASLGIAHKGDSDSDALQRPTPMRSLTLVDKRGVQSSRGEAIAQRRASYSHRRSRSREDLSTIVKHFSHAKDVGGIASAPASAVLPDAAVFSTPMEQSEPTMPDAAYVTTKRQKRNSRIRYLSNGNEIRLDMGDDTAAAPSALPVLDDLKSPRVGASPSGWTPRLHFGPSWAAPSGAPASSEGHGGAEGAGSYNSHRLSDPNADCSSPRSPGSPWLGFESGNEDLQASRDRLQLLTSQTMPGATLPHQYFSDVSEGIRQRSSVVQRPAHRPASSLPPTASVVPYGWASGANKRSSGSARVLFHDTADKAGTVIDVEDTQRSERAHHTRSHSHGRPMSIFVPTSAIEAHLLRSAGVNTTLGHARRRSSWFLPLPSTISTVEQVQPSKSLFYAGFMGMPWLWLIGGWYLSDDGLLVTPSSRVAFWAHEASMREAAERDAANAQALGTAFGHEGEASADTFWSGLDADDSMQMERNIRTLLEHPGDSTNGTTRTLRTVRSRATMQSHFSAGSREAGSPEQIPSTRTRAIASAFASNPEVALFRSPVRETPRSPEQEAEPSVRELAQRHSSGGALRALLEEGPPMRGHRRSSYNYRGGSNAVSAYDGLKSSQAVGLKARAQAHLHHWYSLDGYVVLNRVAAIIAGLLVFAGFSAALAVVVASF